MEKLMIRNVLNKFGFVRIAFAASVGFPLMFAANTFAQLPAPAAPAPPPPGGQAEVERVIVTGSNIPTAEETGPNPVDTYRPQDIEKLGIRSSTDLQNFIPQEAGGTVNLSIGNGGRYCPIQSARLFAQGNPGADRRKTCRLRFVGRFGVQQRCGH